MAGSGAENPGIMPARDMRQSELADGLFGDRLPEGQVLACRTENLAPGGALKALQHLGVIAQRGADLPELIQPMARRTHWAPQLAGDDGAADGQDGFGLGIFPIFLFVVLHAESVVLPMRGRGRGDRRRCWRGKVGGAEKRRGGRHRGGVRPLSCRHDA